MDMYTQIDDPTSGSFVNDLSGKENHAQVHGSPIFHRCKSVTAGCMNALEFAAEDRLTVSHSASLNIAKQITMEAWAQTTVSRAGYIMFKSGAYGFPKFVSNNNVFSYLHMRGLGGLGYPMFVVNQPEATDGNWHYFALTYDGKVIRYYLDGELSHKMKLVDTIRSSDRDIVIGHSQGANTYPDGPVHFAGKISALRISNRARSPDEIRHSARVGNYLLLKK
ncbi:uncharacterized protein [Oscarella lobularis]|uniref:uncharacterized protein n=1 Tax=Oscarella lobularis TaxID=121494 RepID=UPI0033137780